MLKVSTYPLGPIQTNCYIIQDETNHCLIIDPGDEGHRIINKIKKNELTPVAILLTHAHFDHIGAVDVVRDKFNIPVYIHEEEDEWLSNPALNGSIKYPGFPTINGRKADVLLKGKEVLEIGPFKIETRHTPGHSPGSLSFIFNDSGFAVVGDTLFQNGVGRTDLIGGSTAVLLKSIHDELLSLDDDFIIYPGHGDSTTPILEKDSNPYLNGF
ncbi:MBL fold metallo-hydrolase [Sporosarcina siberiensis]|uniref:MBL fold metallo-hydrolase n=1 Tax=Sporosarcina siberiensis TaxID=1365606 RepID=A0ABW4SB64_9BACL